jgi:predicted ABC-type ATPase
VNTKPLLVVVAGVNGAGKTTLTEHFIFRKIHIVNPDIIAKTRSCSIIEAGRMAIAERKELLLKKKDFAIETTLTGNGELAFMQDAKKQGYLTKLVYVGVDEMSLSHTRVGCRVSIGGHSVPHEDILRRYDRSLDNLPKAVEVADKAYIIDNTHKYRLICIKKDNQITLRSDDIPRWFESSLLQIGIALKK